MYSLNHVIDALATPLVIALMIGVVGCICRLSGRRQVATWLLVSSLAVIYVAAIGPISSALLARLENRYASLSDDAALPAVEFVVVLGSGYTPHDGVPVTAALDEDGLVRIVEGIRLLHRLKSAHLVVSGGAPPGQIAPALGYALLARDLGVSESSLIVLDSALDTKAEAKSIFSYLGATPFLMVTSAYHMPRAMRLMEQTGARPIPAPTGQKVNAATSPSWRSLIPTAEGLGNTDRAIHEYLGLLATG